VTSNYNKVIQPSVQGGQSAGESANVNVNRVGFVQGVPQYYAGQPQLGYAYGYYQNPQLNETMLGVSDSGAGK